jgi:hypothetical protein
MKTVQKVISLNFFMGGMTVLGGAWGTVAQKKQVVF